MHRSGPEERTPRIVADEAPGTMPIRTQYSVALLAYARPPPPPAPARAPAARHDRRGRRRAAVHAVGGVAAARDARARDRRTAAGARRPRRAADRPGARPRRARRRPARPRGGRRGRPGGGGRHGRPAAAGSPASSRCSSALALPAMAELGATAPRLRCEVVEAEPEQALPALALGDVDLVLGDEWQHQPWRLPAGLGAARPVPRPGLAAPPRRPPRRARAPRRRAARRARRRGVGDGPRRHGLGGHRAAHVPRAAAASSPTCGTGRTTRRSASRSSPRGFAVTMLPALALPAAAPGHRGAPLRRARRCTARSPP